jgi:glycosyltransferase involved in cell wall biosynthesis
MKIALTTYGLHVGGVETFMFSLADGLLRAGHETEIIVTDEAGPWFGRAREVGANAHFIRGLQRSSRAAHARRAGRFLAAGGFDAVINNNSWFVQASLGVLLPTTATVSVIHNAVEEVISLSCANERACDAFVAVSRATFDLARARVSTPAKIHLITHGIAVPSVPPPARNNTTLAIVYCGRLEQKQKNILILPDVLRRTLLAGVTATIEVIGDGPDRELFASLVVEKGLSAQINSRGALTHEEALERIRQADALILPSFHEGLPMVLLEAMALGAVPVLSLLPGITDCAVRDGVSGLLALPGDVAGFAHALVRLGRDPDLRRRMSLAAWKAARDSFSVKTMVESYLSLLEQLRGQPRRIPALPPLAPDMVGWKDYIPNPLRRAFVRLRKAV